MKWALTLTLWWMNFATLLAHWMLRCGQAVSRADSLPPGVRILSKHGSIVRSSAEGIPSRWLPLGLPLMNTEKPSITWFLLQNTRRTWDSPGLLGEESGAERVMLCTLSF